MPSVPTVKVVLAALVMVGACVTGAVPCTIRVNIWTASGGKRTGAGIHERLAGGIDIVDPEGEVPH